MIDIYSVVLENLFLFLFLTVFVIFFISIPLSIISITGFTVFIFFLSMLFMYTTNIKYYDTLMYMNFIISFNGIIIYYVLHNLYKTKYKLGIFLFPLFISLGYNLYRILDYLMVIDFLFVEK